MARHVRFAAVMLVLVFVSPFANAQDAIAIVNGKTITSEDLAISLRDLANRGRAQVEQANQAPAVLRDLIIERLVEDAYLKGSITTVRGEVTDTTLALRLADRVRRQFLVDAFMRAKIAPPLVLQEEIDRFVRDNPDYFRLRKTYHFSELSIAPPSDTLKSRLNDELRELATQRNIRPQRIEALIDWLNANKLAYTHSKQWRGSEQLSRQLLDRLKELDGLAGKVKTLEANGVVSVVVLYGAYEDPVNPEHTRQALVAQVLAPKSQQEQIKEIGDNLISAGNVEVLEKSFAGALKRADVGGTSVRSATLKNRLSWAVQFGVILLGVFASWGFFRRDHIAAGLTMHDTPGRHFSHSLEARLIVVVIFAVFIIASAIYVLLVTNAVAFPTDATAAALVGIGVALGLILLIWKVSSLNQLFNKRWVIIGGVTVAQLISVALS